MLGSRYSADAMASVGVGQQIDCGVTYTAPGTYNLTANVTWNAYWAKGQATPGGPPANCIQPVPGAGGPGRQHLATSPGRGPRHPVGQRLRSPAVTAAVRHPRGGGPRLALAGMSRAGGTLPR
jgi:hypothetical protein